MSLSRYETVDEIGENHYSKVWSGLDVEMNRSVAIMEIDQRFLRSPSVAEQVWRDIRTMAKVTDRNLVSVYDVDPERGWIVMPLMRGSLGTQLKKGPISPELARSVLRQVLEALRVIHAHHLCHGDVKPNSILYNDEGRVLLSFSPGLVLGGSIPPRREDQKYQAPELIHPKFGSIGPATDLYCLGFSILELLVGSRFDELFKGTAHDPKTAWTRWHGDPEQVLPAAGQCVRNLPEDLATVLDRLLRKKVSERFDSADEVLQQLQDAPPQRVQVPDQVPPSPTPPSPRPTPQVTVVERPSNRPNPQQVGTSRPESESPAAEPQRRATTAATANLPLRQRINKTLENPLLMAAVIALILLPVGIFGWYTFFPSATNPDDPGKLPDLKFIFDPPIEGVELAVNGSSVPVRGGEATLTRPPQDELSITAKAPGYEPYELQKKASEFTDSTLQVSLKKKPITPPPPPPPTVVYKFIVTPASASDVRFRVNGQPLALTKNEGSISQSELGSGPSVDVEVTAQDYEPFQEVVTLNRLSPSQPFPIALKPARKDPPPPQAREIVVVVIPGNPPGLKVSLEGKYGVAQGGQVKFQLAPEKLQAPTVQLAATADGFQGYQRQVPLQALLANVPYEIKLERVVDPVPMPIPMPMPEDPRAVARRLYVEGQGLARLGHWAEAAEKYQQTLALVKDDADYHREYGIAIYFQGNRHRDALVALNKAVELDPKDARAYFYLGECNFDLREYPTATTFYSKALEVDSNLAAAYIGRGFVYYGTGKHPEAIQDAKAAIKIKPENPKAHYLLALALDASNQPKDALLALDAAIERNKNFYEAYFYRGKLRWKSASSGSTPVAQQEIFKAARQDLDRVIELQPDYADAFNLRGSILSDMGQNAAALLDFDQAIKLSPEYAAAYWNRGLVYKVLGNEAKRQADHQRAAQLDPAFRGTRDGKQTQ